MVFSPLSWKEKALTQRGLLVQAGDQSGKFLPAGVLGRITPGRCLGAFYRSGGVALGGIWRCLPSGNPQAVALLLGDLLEKATQHLERVSMRHRPRVTITISGLPLDRSDGRGAC